MAGSINKIILVGRLGQDPKVTYLPSGNPVCEMSLATDESYKDRDGNKVERTEWHRVKCFGHTAEFCSKYLSKGRLVYVEGSNKTRSWDDQQGQKRYVTEVVVSAPGHTVQALDRGQDQGSQNSARQTGGGYGRAQQDMDTGPAFPSEASGMDQMPGDGLSDVPFALILAPLATLATAAMQGGWLC